MFASLDIGRNLVARTLVAHFEGRAGSERVSRVSKACQEFRKRIKGFESVSKASNLSKVSQSFQKCMSMFWKAKSGIPICSGWFIEGGVVRYPQHPPALVTGGAGGALRRAAQSILLAIIWRHEGPILYERVCKPLIHPLHTTPTA